MKLHKTAIGAARNRHQLVVTAALEDVACAECHADLDEHYETTKVARAADFSVEAATDSYLALLDELTGR